MAGQERSAYLRTENTDVATLSAGSIDVGNNVIHYPGMWDILMAKLVFP
jgi:hypothetical protein